MSKLSDYIRSHAERGECVCGRCADAATDPKQPSGHTADLVFFKVKAVNDPTADELRNLVRDHHGEFGEVNPLDGEEHNYMEIGGFVGDQGYALMLMGLGSILGVWKLLTPLTFGFPAGLAMQMAQAGMVTIKGAK